MINRLLDSKVGLVTGCSSGIGKAVAERFAEEGAVVYANARTHGSIDDWALQVSANSVGDIRPVYFDVTDSNRCKEVLLQIKKECSSIDFLINNAGLIRYELLPLTSIEGMKEMFEVNVIAMTQLIQIASRIMSRNRKGSIVNVSSIVGVRGVSGQLGYSATKGAVNSLTKSAGKELADKNIRVNAVAPGMVATDRFVKIMEDRFQEKVKDIGMGRLAEPREIADACLFFASDLSTYVTGQILEVDGATRL